MEKRDRYPIGLQDFKMLRTRGSYYVDKTKYIARILQSDTQYYFLARPRRFGKSLFLSTLRYFFEGEHELFKGLYIDSADWNWDKYPVLYLDLNNGDYSDPKGLERVLNKNLRRWEAAYGVEKSDEDSFVQRFESVIETAFQKTGRQVIILVDEYDKPLVKNLNTEAFEMYRAKLASLYSNLKTCSSLIKMVFLTGVSRFSKLSVFSDLNNLRDITFQDEFADICGITEQELYSYFSEGIGNLAAKKGISYEEVCARLKDNYDGYRFSENGSDIYNPWSVLNCMSSRDITNYWNMTGMPTLIAETLKNIHADLKESLNCECDKKKLLGMDLKSADPTALLYQTGYLTIKDYDQELQTFHLGVPNREVREGLFDVLLPYYVKAERGTASMVMEKLVISLKHGRPQAFMESLQAYFAGIAYMLKMENENNFHNAFYILCTLLGISAKAEIQTSDGRIDMLLESINNIFVIELKYDGTARQALDQINEKRYDLQFRNDPRTVYRIGASFSSETRTIGEWLIED